MVNLITLEVQTKEGDIIVATILCLLKKMWKKDRYRELTESNKKQRNIIAKYGE